MKQVRRILALFFLATITTSCSFIGNFCIALLVGGAIGGIIALISLSADKKKTEEFFQKLATVRKENDFTETRATKGFYMSSSYFGADDTKNKILYMTEEEFLLFSYEDIIAAEICVDGHTTYSKKSISAGGAIAGGILGGGIGAVIGGAGLGSTTSDTVPNNISVHIVLRNQQNPSINVRCITGERARDVMDIVSLAIDKIDKENKAPAESVVETKSVVQELKDLTELLNSGAISNEEFAELKRKLISK